MSGAKAAQACIDRFNGKSYEPGKRDCAILVCHALHHAGRSVPFLKGKTWTSEAGALKLLRRLGFTGLAEAVDAAGLERIAPASARVGDIVAMPASNPAWDCVLTVCVGNGRVLGFIEGRAAVVQPKAYITAWRV